MKYSFIISAYNIEKYIKKCIESVLSQPSNDYEIIIVDDGSVDTTPEIIKSFLPNKIIKVIKKENGGLGSTRNVGLKNAKGEYIIFIDGDDWIEKNYLEKVTSIIEKNNMPDLVRIGYFIDYDNYREISAPIFENDSEIIKKMVLTDKLSSQSWLNVAKKELYDGVVFPKTLYEDLPTTYKIYFNAKTIVVDNSPIYHYVQRRNSISNSFSEKKPLGLLYGFKEKYNYAKTNNLKDCCDVLIDKVIYNSIQSIRYLSITKKSIKKIKTISKEAIMLYEDNKKKNRSFELLFAKNFTYLYKCIVSIVIRRKKKNANK